MKLKSLVYLLMMGFAWLLAGCDDEDSAFSGNENYITSFRLVQEGKSYAATIDEDKLTLLVPENVSLQGAVAEVLYSELATVAPEPSTITDWEENQTLTVTSYSGKVRTYTYSLRRSQVSSDGTVTLETDEDVKAFAARGINRIDGSLIIGKETGSVAEDSLLSFAALSSLKEVTGAVVINPTYRGTSLAGLENLEKVGALKVVGRIGNNGAYGNKELGQIELPHLKMVNSDLYLSADTLHVLNFPVLESVGGTLTLEVMRFKQLEFPALQVIGKDLTFSTSRGRVYELIEDVHFPALKMLGNQLTLSNYRKVKNILFPALVSAGNLSIQSLADLENVRFTSLSELADQFSLQYPMNNLDEVSLPRLVRAEGVRIYNNGMRKLDLGSLVSVGKKNLVIEHCQNLTEMNLSSLVDVDGNVSISNLGISDLRSLDKLKSVAGNLDLNYNAQNQIRFDGCQSLESVGGNFTVSGSTATSLSGFDALKKIGGTLSLSSMPEVTEVSGLGSLSSVGKIWIDRLPKLNSIPFLTKIKGVNLASFTLRSPSAMTELDLSGLKIEELALDDTPVGMLLKGDAAFEGKVTLTGCRGMRFEGLDNMQTLSVTIAIMREDATFSFAGLKTVKKLTVNQAYSANKAVADFTDLEEVSGALELTEGSYLNNMVQPTQFPKLQKAGALTYAGILKTLSLPALQEVTGLCSISTCYVNGVPAMLENIDLPSLKRVGGLKLTTSNGYSNSNQNTSITNLDCFGSLEYAGSVTIERQMALISYKGLAKVISHLDDASSWTVSDNAYNPTFEEVKSGKLEME